VGESLVDVVPGPRRSGDRSEAGGVRRARAPGGRRQRLRSTGSIRRSAATLPPAARRDRRADPDGLGAEFILATGDPVRLV